MKRPIPAVLAPAVLAVVAVMALAAPAQAACYAQYKAKQDNPLRFHVGVAEVADADCSKAAAKRALAPRLAQGGWTLLNVIDIFGPEGLDEGKASAREYFLRY